MLKKRSANVINGELSQLHFLLRKKQLFNLTHSMREMSITPRTPPQQALHSAFIAPTTSRRRLATFLYQKNLSGRFPPQGQRSQVFSDILPEQKKTVPNGCRTICLH